MNAVLGAWGTAAYLFTRRREGREGI